MLDPKASTHSSAPIPRWDGRGSNLLCLRKFFVDPQIHGSVYLNYDCHVYLIIYLSNVLKSVFIKLYI